MLIENKALTKNEMLKISFYIYKKCFLKLYPAFLLFTCLNLFINFFNKNLISEHAQIALGKIVQSSVLMIIQGIIISYLIAYAMYQINNFIQSRQVSIKKALIFPCKRLLTYILASIISLCSLIIGSILFMLPGVFLSIALMPFMALVVLDNHNPFSAWILSVKMIWGSWWRIFALYFILGIFIFLLLFVLVGIFSLIQVSLGKGCHIFSYIEILLGIFESLVLAYLPALNVIVWRDLKVRYNLRS